MSVKTMPVPLDVGRAACADPEHLPLVDAATAKPGGPAAQEMKARLCRHCPVARQCFAWAATHPEVGIWGGTSPRQRTNAGAPSAASNAKRNKTTPRIKHERTRPLAATEVRVRELGIRECDVRRWAYEQGLVRSIRGRVALATIEAWATAHQAS